MNTTLTTISDFFTQAKAAAAARHVDDDHADDHSVSAPRQNSEYQER